MKYILPLLLVALITFTGCALTTQKQDDGFISIFNGKDLTNWKANTETANCFFVENGELVVKGGRAHLFYNGDEIDYKNLKDFHYKVMVKTTKGSNSGLYFHTKYQENGWPKFGYECQVNITHKDRIKSSAIYGLKNVDTVPAKDGEWYLQEIIVKGKHIVTKINGEIRAEYTEPDTIDENAGRKLRTGTFAIQGHDPTCLVYLKDFMVKPL